MKISIIGCGKVGATIGYTAALQGLAHEIVMVDAFADKAQGEALDILQCQPFTPQSKLIAGGMDCTTGSDVVVITAGIPRKADEPRVLLLSKNATLIADLVKQAVALSPDCILFMVTNPLDVMTHLAYKISGLPSERVLGMGTVLDTARYRAYIAQNLGIDARDVTAYVLGEHGETMVPVSSGISVRGIPLDQFPGYSKDVLAGIRRQVIEASSQVIRLKGGTVFAPAVSACAVLAAIVNNTNSVLPVCTYHDQFGVALSLPTLVGRRGAGAVMPLALTSEDQAGLDRSIANIKSYADDLKDFI